MKFTKAQTNGNDFVIIEGFSNKFNLDFKKLIADRRYCIGCDQLIFIGKKSSSCYPVEFFNQDGTKATMCGNGACTAAIYIRDIIRDKHKKIIMKINETEYKATTKDGRSTVFFSTPTYFAESSNEEIKFVSTGNKHIVIDTTNNREHDAVTAEDLKDACQDFNMHFIKKEKKAITIKTFERGVGWTKACGSGAIASVFAFGELGETLAVHEGGTSVIVKSDEEMSLTTEPKLVFDGFLNLNKFSRWRYFKTMLQFYINISKDEEDL